MLKRLIHRARASGTPATKKITRAAGAIIAPASHFSPFGKRRASIT